MYIMTNKHNTTLYTGVTSNIVKRVLQHKKGVFPGSFSDQYLCHERVWKDGLIAKYNAEWKDLSEGWYHERDLA